MSAANFEEIVQRLDDSQAAPEVIEKVLREKGADEALIKKLVGGVKRKRYLKKARPTLAIGFGFMVLGFLWADGVGAFLGLLLGGSLAGAVRRFIERQKRGAY
ncbi:MAG TPA: hypothetical protein VLL52_13655 [Anaerolineae bacterium]|nr:hypothetical protein [Anaerolineae bacterium]